MAEGELSWAVLLEAATEQLATAGFESPSVDARRIVEEAAGIEPADLPRVLGHGATVRGVAGFDRMLARRLSGEPLQYVVGRWGFRTLDLVVDHRVLVPRPETEVVAGLAIAEVEARAAGDHEVIVVDLGTGSGAIALAIAAECPAARVLATDRSSAALALARANLAGIGRDATRVSLHEGSWFEALPDELAGSVDVLVANPPYVADGESLPEVVDRWEPSEALRAGPRGTEQIEAIIDGLEKWLAPDGRVVLEMAPHQTAEMAARLERGAIAATVHRDLSGRERAVVGKRR